MPGEKHYRKLERAYLAAPINEYYQPRLLVADGSCDLRIDVRPEFHHAAEAVHGSVYFKMLDDAAFFAANSLVDDVFLLTASFHIHMTRPVGQGEMRAIGKVVHQTRNNFVAESKMFDEEGRLLACGSGSFVRSKIRLGPEIGYV